MESCPGTRGATRACQTTPTKGGYSSSGPSERKDEKTKKASLKNCCPKFYAPRNGDTWSGTLSTPEAKVYASLCVSAQNGGACAAFLAGKCNRGLGCPYAHIKREPTLTTYHQENFERLAGRATRADSEHPTKPVNIIPGSSDDLPDEVAKYYPGIKGEYQMA